MGNEKTTSTNIKHMTDHYYYDYDAEYVNRFPGRNAINNISAKISQKSTSHMTGILISGFLVAAGVVFYFYRKKRRENRLYNRTSSEILEDSDVPLVSARTNSDSNILEARNQESWLDEDFDVVIPRAWNYVKNGTKNYWKKLQDFVVEKQDSSRNSSGNVTINLSLEDLETTLRNLRIPPRRSTSLLQKNKAPVRSSSLKSRSKNRVLRRERSRMHQEMLRSN